jgi:hypothetical protein
MTLTPAYGRDYKSVKEVTAAFNADQDFCVADMFSGPGTYTNRQDLLKSGIGQVTIRYKSLRSVTVVKVK